MEGLSPMKQALLLLIVGMGTVFIILILIINLSKGLILLVNKIAPEEAPKKAAPAPAPAAVSPVVSEVIRKAVSQVAGNVIVTDIKKL